MLLPKNAHDTSKLCQNWRFTSFVKELTLDDVNFELPFPLAEFFLMNPQTLRDSQCLRNVLDWQTRSM